MVGRLLLTLEEVNLVDNTVIIFTSDHGFNLGDHGQLGKRSVFVIYFQLVVLAWWHL